MSISLSGFFLGLGSKNWSCFIPVICAFWLEIIVLNIVADIYLLMSRSGLCPHLLTCCKFQALKNLCIVKYMYLDMEESKQWIMNNIHLLDLFFYIFLGSSLLSVLFLEKDNHLITGSADGQVRDWKTCPRITLNQIIVFRSFRKMFVLGVVLCSRWWAQVPSGEKNGSSENGKKASRAPKAFEPPSR